MRASKFFGKSEPGSDVCAFCAAQIEGKLAKKDFIKDTFTDFGDLLRPGSPYICAGCAASLGDCVQPVKMTDGGRWDKYRLRVSGIGHLEGSGMGRREWERLYYGDFLRRANAIRFSRGERIFPD